MTVSEYENVNAFHELLHDLKQTRGKWWKEIIGEAHIQYDEAAFWVLLYDDSIVEETHSYLLKRLAPYERGIKPMNLYISYEAIIDNKIFDCANFRRGKFRKSNIDLSKSSEGRSLKSSSVFKNCNSKYV